jgi:GNAT superfamily N-acetyltransferase
MSDLSQITYALAVSDARFRNEFQPSLASRFNVLGSDSRGGDNHEYLLLRETAGHRVVAGAWLHTYPGNFYINYLETANDARGYGYGAHLFAKLFEHASQRGVHTLEVSEYSTAGERHLEPHQTRLQALYPHILVRICTPRNGLGVDSQFAAYG